jgi:mRNA-degrading endonuclease RelE of RelBE toxin-antitoxin system
MIFKELQEFQKELKKLCKKFRNLEKDFIKFKNGLEDDPI